MIIHFIILLISCEIIEGILDDDKCQKVTQELEMRGIDIGGELRLSKTEEISGVCISTEDSNSKEKLSCCNEKNEKKLLSMASEEYKRLLTKELQTVAQRIKDLNKNIYDMSNIAVTQFIGSLQALKVPNDFMNKRWLLERRNSIQNYREYLVSYLNGTESTDTLQTKTVVMVSQLIYLHSMDFCIYDRKIRHWRHRQYSRMKDIHAFILTDHELQTSIINFVYGLKITKTLYEAIQSTLQVIETLLQCRECDSTTLCDQRIIKMHHCSFCAGEILTRPCLSICMQVLGDCVLPYQQFSDSWKNIFGLVESILAKSKRSGDLFETFSDLFINLITIIKSTTQKKQNTCLAMDDYSIVFPRSIRKRLNFLYYMVESELRIQKIFWEKLPFYLCIRSEWFSTLSSTETCWNGSTVTNQRWHHCSFCDGKGDVNIAQSDVVQKSLRILQSIYQAVKFRSINLSERGSRTVNISNDITKSLDVRMDPDKEQSRKLILSSLPNRNITGSVKHSLIFKYNDGSVSRSTMHPAKRSFIIYAKSSLSVFKSVDVKIWLTFAIFVIY